MQPPSHRLLPSFLSFVFAMALFSAATKPASAQQDQTPKRGFQAGGSYALSDIETINGLAGGRTGHGTGIDITPAL